VHGVRPSVCLSHGLTRLYCDRVIRCSLCQIVLASCLHLDISVFCFWRSNWANKQIMRAWESPKEGSIPSQKIFVRLHRQLCWRPLGALRVTCNIDVSDCFLKFSLKFCYPIVGKPLQYPTSIATTRQLDVNVVNQQLHGTGTAAVSGVTHKNRLEREPAILPLTCCDPVILSILQISNNGLKIRTKIFFTISKEVTKCECHHDLLANKGYLTWLMACAVPWLNLLYIRRMPSNSNCF